MKLHTRAASARESAQPKYGEGGYNFAVDGASREGTLGDASAESCRCHSDPKLLKSRSST
jgi:hypothetical protein